MRAYKRIQCATASGSAVSRNDPVGTGTTTTIKGVVNTSAVGGCCHLKLTYGGNTWNSPTTCGTQPGSINKTFTSFLFVPADVRLCAGAFDPAPCGTPATIR